MTRKDAANFPQYVFIEPKYFWPGENDQHPTSDIRRGDALIATV
jgi:phospholipase C